MKNENILTPKSRKCIAIDIRETGGFVNDESALLSFDQSAVRLEHKNGIEPYVILDLGPASPGGYPFFKVKSFSDNARLRISYYDTLETTSGQQAKKYGDFKRGTCRYLGVELPVLPANPNRYELYTITHKGEYFYPLIQGQQRFVRVTLTEENTFLELEYFYIYYTSDMSSYDGDFSCSDSRFTKLWYSSVYTAQLASIKSDQWEAVEGKLALRTLTKSEDLGTLSNRIWENSCFEFTTKISHNPDMISGVCWAIGADDDTCLSLRLDLDGTFHIDKYSNGNYSEVISTIKLNKMIYDNNAYIIKTITKGNKLSVYLDGGLIYEDMLPYKLTGKIGFCQSSEKYAVIENISVIDETGISYICDSFEDLSDWQFARTPVFMADGAKRDRLPWSGDLDFAGRNIYYAFKNAKSMAGALRLLAFHQNPQGYMYATCYPENNIKPSNKQWGDYESDIFSAWTIIALADYVLYTGDKELAAELYEPIKRNLDYLWHYVGGDGVFYQRLETSKGLWDHEIGDSGKITYNNLIIYNALCKGAFLAETLDKKDNFSEYMRRADKMKDGILNEFWDDDNGYFIMGEGKPDFCFMANSLALSIMFATVEQAKRISKRLLNVSSHGKIVALAIRGLFNYGFNDFAIKLLIGKNKLPEDMWGQNCYVSWLGVLDDNDAPHTTTECMIYPFLSKGDALNWGDMSHPDTGMAGILSAYILGIQPVSAGFREYTVCPRCLVVANAQGTVPLADGREIKAEWNIEKEKFTLKLNHPEGCTANIILNECFDIQVNGKNADDVIILCQEGEYIISGGIKLF